jgi:hypothetical protein
VVTFVHLRDAHVGAASNAATAWDQLAGKSRTLERRVIDELARPLRNSGWKGDAASAAFERMTSLHSEFELVAVQTRNLAIVLRAAATEFDRLQRNLQAAVEAVALLGLRMNADGTVSAPELSWDSQRSPAASDTHRLATQNAEIYTDTIRKIVAQATDTDSRFADALRKFNPDDAQGINPYSWNHANQAAHDAAALLGLSADSVPKSGSDPKTVAAWWASLSPDQRDLAVTAYPDRVGGLDGLPTVDRDRANRLFLRDQIGDDDNNYRDPDDPHHQRLVKLLGRLDASDYDPPAKHLYLLGVNNQGDGQAIVSVGNPDTARHTAVVVPGVSTNLDGMGGQIQRATQIQVAADRLTFDADGDVAVVAWLGYDPPQMNETVITAAGSHRAEAGAGSLDRFADGLRASHDSTPSHITALGHSYGSVVVGNAASDGHHLAVDDIVTAGSPGMDVNRAGDLNVGARHVWAGSATDDPIASPATAIPYVGTGVAGGTELAHGVGPQHPEFGGNVYHVDTQGHSGYWDDNSQSLQNQARVIVGFYDQVGLDYGEVPR